MSYSLTWHAAEAELDSLYDDFDAWDDAWNRWGPASRFALNSKGMVETVHDMRTYGMVYESDPGPWPESPVQPTARYPYTPEQISYLRNAGVQERPGIPTHKLSGSNDPWHITTLEVQGALHEYERSEVRFVGCWQRWVEWIDFLRASVEHGGIVGTASRRRGTATPPRR